MGDRERKSSPLPENVEALAYRYKWLSERFYMLDTEHGKLTEQLTGIRSDLSTLADSSRDNSTTKRIGAWALGILIPLTIIGAVSVIQSMGRQEVLEKTQEVATQKAVVTEGRIRTIEVDVGVIKSEQQQTRRTLQKVSETLEDMAESQARLEEVVTPRNRRR